MKKTIALLFISALLVSASTITIELTGTSGVSDGTDYVLPYFLSINGGTPVTADCYDFFDQVTVGESWTANEYDLAQVEVSGQYAAEVGATQNYELAGILSTMITTSAQDQIDLQHDLWNLFDPGSFTPDAGMATYLATATSELPGFNFSGIEYVEGVSGTTPAVQAFVIHSDTLRFADSPEPGTMMLTLLGLIGLAGVCMRRRA